MTEEHVIRYQFPLVLAWALTHWKAQGMTLRRVRIALEKRVAQSPGIGYVCVTRVRHPGDIVFEIDFPEYETFQSAKHKEAFRERCRFELRLRARASRTILKYAAGDGVPRVVCEADEWTEGDALRTHARAAGIWGMGIGSTPYARTHARSGYLGYGPREHALRAHARAQRVFGVWA